MYNAGRKSTKKNFYSAVYELQRAVYVDCLVDRPGGVVLSIETKVGILRK